MPQIVNAYQLLYSRVEADYSPKGRSGYQVVFHSPALSAQEVSTIERRVQCFQGEGEVRTQFFILETRRAVLIRCVTITPDATINDKDMRRGVFIAHALIFEPQDFARIGNDPFWLLDAPNVADMFLSDAEGLADALRTKNPTLSLTVSSTPRAYIEPPSQWSGAELAKLAIWMERTTIDQTLMFLGGSYQVEEMMRVVHYFASRHERLLLSFDTWVDGCQPPPNTYWAVGGRKRITNSKFVVVDLERPRLPDTPATTAPKVDGYGSWLKHFLKDSVQTVIEYTPTAQFLGDVWRDGQWSEPTFALSAVAIDHFVTFHWQTLSPRIVTVLEAHLNSAMAQSLVSQLPQLGWSQFDLFYLAILQQPQLNRLAMTVYQWILQTGASDLSGDADKLVALGEAGHHPQLQVVGLLNTKKGMMGRVFSRGDKTGDTLEAVLNA